MVHTLRGSVSTRVVFLDGHVLDPKPSLDYWNHSPDGFNWGYGGSGPAQLALAVVLALTGHAAGYQDFKWSVISRLPIGGDFSIRFVADGPVSSWRLENETKI